MLISGFYARFLAGFAILLGTPMLAHAIAVTSTAPVGNANNVARNASIQINFDQPLATASITSSSFRVWGTQSGPAAGTTAFSNGDQTLTFTPSASFFPGEWISIQLAHSIEGADSSSLRSAGFAFQFQTRAGVGSMQSSEIDVVSVSLEGETTRLYGGAITDLNRDGWIDYIAVNEISHDLRVLLNRADGSGLLGPVLTPPTAIGSEASPSTVADFNNDGLMDVATGNSSSNDVSIALGSGDGHFASVQNLDVGTRPHGIVALDVDGDGDLDIVVASENGGSLSLLVNDGQGVFGGRVDFANQDGDGKYALGAGDMNGDGILDLVVGTSTDDRILVLKGNGDGTFTQTADIAGGGYGWKLTLGDVNNDGKLDVAQANGPNDSGSILLGNGDGTLQAATIYSFSGTMVGSSLGDLDGDGYLDWVLSSYGSGRWYVMKNNGDGSFSQVDEIPAPSNASCASLYDFDNDGTLDMALADEVSDEIVLMKNDGAGTVENADIAVTMSVDTPVYGPGEALTFTLTVANNGPDASPGTHIVDAFPPEFLSPTWTCVGGGGASGAGDIDRIVDLSSGGQIVCTILGFSSDVSSSITNTATASVASPVQDPVASNNSATVTATAAESDTIFAGGFE
jgi:uncharacterized repeat protein (TIGR01451 family)